MKRTDLAKSLAKKIQVRMQQTPAADRFGVAAGAHPDRREQRKLDQAAGLVPFAVKLHKDVVARLNEEAARRGVGLSELTARLIDAGWAALATGGDAAVDTPAGKGKNAAEAAPAMPSTAKAPAKKAAKSPAKAAAETAAGTAAKKSADQKPPAKKPAAKAPAKAPAQPASAKPAAQAPAKSPAKKSAKSRPV